MYLKMCRFYKEWKIFINLKNRNIPSSCKFAVAKWNAIPTFHLKLISKLMNPRLFAACNVTLVIVEAKWHLLRYKI